jgi:HlyD family secretion protein
MIQNSQPSKRLFLPPQTRWTVALGLVSLVAMGAGTILLTRPQTNSKPEAPIVTNPPREKVNALGRLEPQGEVIQVSAPTSMGTRSRVAHLLVKEGDSVRAGETIAILDSRDRTQASLREAKQQVKIAQAALAQVKAGARRGEIAARRSTVQSLQAQLSGDIQSQQATVSRLAAELHNAQSEFDRYRLLYREGAISASERDRRRLTVDTARERWQEAKANLERTQRTLQARIAEANSTVEQVAEVRPTDVAAAQAEVDGAIATVERLQEELNLTYVRAPKDGQILRLHARGGELIDEENGIVELGQLDRMYVVAEVYESDINQIEIGQTATITSPTKAFSQTLQGKVDEIGFQVAKRDVLDTDPTAATDARVVEVKIRLDENATRQVTRLTNAQVNVEIALRS